VTRFTIASVVEGYGEVQSLPVLLPRIAYELLCFTVGLRVESGCPQPFMGMGTPA
jgi:hypothetical protein